MKSRCMNCMRKLENDTGACPHCGFDPGKYKPPEQTLPPGATLYNGKYIIGRVLGRGGFGVTYVALDTTLELRVAIKECLPRNCAWRNDSGASVQWGLSVPEQEAMLESFVKEARKMAKIDQIPGVVRVREYFYDNETAYIVMDYVEGETLAQYLRRNGSLSAEACFRLLAPAMDSLAEAHKRGLIHRDISPNNIMIERGGKKVWVLDLGAAKDLGSRISAPNVSAGTQIIGTPGYTPLEQYDPDGKIGPWTDIYAMSSTFFHCMTGQKPPASTSRAQKDDVPELLRTIRGPVGAVLEKGLAQNQDDRYQSMTELRDALESAIDDTAHTKTYEGATEILTREPEEPKPPPKKHMLALFLILIIGLALVVFGMIRLNDKPYAEIIADKWEASINETGTSELINHGNGEFEIQNPVANHAAFTQVVTVKPHTDYKFHVMYSMTDYQPGDENSVGACIAVQSTEASGILYGLTVGAAEAGSTWGWNTYGLGFNSGDATSVLLYLSNGRNSAKSSGTAYFKDITLEEMSGTNEFTVIG